MGSNIPVSSKESNADDTSLYFAIYDTDYKKVTKLLHAGTNPNQKVYSGNTPLHAAIFNQNIDFVKLLLAKGANINEKNNGGYTPTHIAVQYGILEIAKLLLDNGADPNLSINDGNTALHLAVGNNNKKMIELLITGGAININAKNMVGNTPLHVATYLGHKDIVELLLGKNASVYVKNAKNHTPSMVTKDDGILGVFQKHENALFIKNKIMLAVAHELDSNSLLSQEFIGKDVFKLIIY